MRLARRLWLAAALTPLANLAAADIPVSDGAAVEVTVSAKELTRLTMTDGRHIAKVWAVEGAMQAQPDADTGEVYIRPLDKAPGQAFSFFVRDEFGSTYTLAARVADLPSQTVRLKPAARSVPAAIASGTTADTHLQRIKTLIRGMASQPRAVTPDYSIESVDRSLPLWKDAEVQLLQRWNGSPLKGEIWLLRNRSKEELRLDEARFAAVYPDVSAVAIDTPVLAPGASTEVYLARGR